MIKFRGINVYDNNLYSYCLGNPVLFIDGNGYKSWVKVINLSGYYSGKTKCYQGVCNLILTTTLAVYTFLVKENQQLQLVLQDSFLLLICLAKLRFL